MEALYNDASDWLSTNWVSCVSQGWGSSRRCNKALSFFYIIDPIMCDCPSIKPLALSDDLDFENLDDFDLDNSIDDYEATSSAPASTSIDSSTATICIKATNGTEQLQMLYQPWWL
jgi:hypothetical protein